MNGCLVRYVHPSLPKLELWFQANADVSVFVKVLCSGECIDYVMFIFKLRSINYVQKPVHMKLIMMKPKPENNHHNLSKFSVL